MDGCCGQWSGERDAVAERIQHLQAQAEARLQRAQQLGVLQAIRLRKESCAHQHERMAQASAREAARQRGRLQRLVASPRGGGVSRAEGAAWEEHERAWASFLQAAHGAEAQHIPWPPSIEGILEAMAGVELRLLGGADGAAAGGAGGGGACCGIHMGDELQRQRREVAVRHAYRKAALRWHPDKLASRLRAPPGSGRPLTALEPDAREKAAAVFIAVNEQWQAWLRAGRRRGS